MSRENDLPKTRMLKVYDKILFRCKNNCLWQRSTAVLFPEIRLMGKWLADCGFKPGQHIEVRQEENKLTITPAWFEQERDEDQ